MLSQLCNIIIDRGVSAPGHVIEGFNGLNTTHKRSVFHLMSTVQLPGSEQFKKMTAHTATQSTDMSLALEFQNNLSN